MVYINQPDTKYGVSRYFGNGHDGIDYRFPVNTPVYAAGDGVVADEGNASAFRPGSLDSWMAAKGGNSGGIYVLIKHSDMYTGYAHLSSTVVNKGQPVKEGQLIGYSGNTGTSSGPHLHFEVIDIPQNWQNGYSARIDPMPFFRPAQQEQPKQSQGGDMVTNQDQLNRMYDAVLRRPRALGEGEDVYLGKDSGFVFNDLYASQERTARVQAEQNDRAALVQQRDQAIADTNMLKSAVVTAQSNLDKATNELKQAQSIAEDDDATIKSLTAQLAEANAKLAEQGKDTSGPSEATPPVKQGQSIWDWLASFLSQWKR